MNKTERRKKKEEERKKKEERRKKKEERRKKKEERRKKKEEKKEMKGWVSYDFKDNNWSNHYLFPEHRLQVPILFNPICSLIVCLDRKLV